MARKRFTEEQIIGILKKHSQGAKISDLSREINISETTIYKWIAKFGGMEVSDARRLRALEDENRRLKHIVADQTLDIQALKALNSKNFLSPK
ncbi:MAG: transposase [Candidatus Omnitrophica bacterium]|nr:transposase [Candidatus Omnitrophota bacterium]